MGNQFVNIPVPVGNGVGAWVDVSTFGSVKTLVVDGAWVLPTRPPTVNIEMSNDAGPVGTPAPVCTFHGRGIKNVTLAARWMRVRISNFRGGVNPIVNMGGNDDGCTFASLPVTASNGTGAPVDISALGSFKTVQVGNPFGGSIVIEYSEDAAGLEWAQAQGIQAPGQFSSVVTAFWARVKRVGAGGPGLPIVNLAGTEPSGGGGSMAFTTVTMQELRFDPEISPVALAAGETNNYNPAGFGTTTRIRQATNAANSALSGLVAQNDGDFRIIENLGPGTLTFEHEDASSAVANRFTLPGATNLVIASGGAAMFIYDGTTSRWLSVSVVGVSGAISGVGTPNTVTKFSGANTLADSQITDDGIDVKINAAGDVEITALGADGDVTLTGTGSGYIAMFPGPTGFAEVVGRLRTTGVVDFDSDLNVDGVLKIGAAGFGSAFIANNTINGQFGLDADAILYINNLGYNGGVTRFRSLEIDDGKGAAIATFAGPTKLTSLAGALSVAGAITMSAAEFLTGIISPAALGAADNPDYAPAGFATSRIIRLTSGGAASTLSGIAGGANGMIITLVNISASVITVLAASGLSAAANQFASGTVLAATGSATAAQSYFYDGVDSLWRTI
jgi:hypothetical protein